MNKIINQPEYKMNNIPFNIVNWEKIIILVTLSVLYFLIKILSPLGYLVIVILFH